jgi:hypothetical protein
MGERVRALRVFCAFGRVGRPTLDSTGVLPSFWLGRGLGLSDLGCARLLGNAMTSRAR